MASRVNPYTIFRKIHLYSGFTVLAFLIMYFTTGFVMTHPDWFAQAEPQVTRVERPLNLPSGISLVQLPVFLQKEFDIRGQRKKCVVNENGEIKIDYIRPGFHSQAIISPDKNMLTLISQKENLYRALVVFHRLHEFGGGGVYELYIIMMDLSSIALLIFALSGLFLWFKLSKNKLFGWMLLGLSLGYTFFVVWSFMKGLS